MLTLKVRYFFFLNKLTKFVGDSELFGDSIKAVRSAKSE